MKLPVKLPAKLTKFGGKLLLKTKKASPEICVIVGIVCGGAAVVLTGIETWKGKDKLSEDVKHIREIKANNAEKSEKSETSEDQKAKSKELTVARVGLAKDICKTYWKPVVFGVSSVGLIWGGRTLLRKELSMTAAAFATLKNQYDNLCRRINEELGPEKAQELIYGAKMADFIDAETGEVGETAMIDKAKNVSPYAEYFDPGDYDSEKGMFIWKNNYWNENKIINQNTIVDRQNYWNMKLHTRGYVYLNEVRVSLGMKPVSYGWKVGWVDGQGDSFIDFGVLPGPHQLPINKLFMDEKNPFNNALIDFNVDGEISYIFSDILEYDTNSNLAFAKRRKLHS